MGQLGKENHPNFANFGTKMKNEFWIQSQTIHLSKNTSIQSNYIHPFLLYLSEIFSSIYSAELKLHLFIATKMSHFI